MKKIIVSVFVAILFVAYVVYQRTQTGSSTNPNALLALNSNTSQSVDTSPASNPANVNGNSNGTNSNGNTNTKSSSSGSTKSSGSGSTNSNSNSGSNTNTSTQTGKFKNGVYTGVAADAYYGNVQVKATISGGQLTSIEFLQYPNDRANSIQINSYALPILRSEAIKNQTARVDMVSGATDSSQAFIQSLSSALSQAA